MPVSMRAKLVVAEANNYYSNDGNPTQTSLKMRAVGASEYPNDGYDENNTFSRWTPLANLEMAITNPDLSGKFEVGQEFYVDFTPVKV